MPDSTNPARERITELLMQRALPALPSMHDRPEQRPVPPWLQDMPQAGYAEGENAPHPLLGPGGVQRFINEETNRPLSDEDVMPDPAAIIEKEI